MLNNINVAARSLAARECEQSTEWRDIADAACLRASTLDEKTQMLLEKYSKMFFRLQQKCIEADYLRDMLKEFEVENAEQATEIVRLKEKQVSA